MGAGVTVRGVWDLLGTAQQQGIINEALDRCSFPFDALAPGLLASVGRTTIPVEWADLSVYAADVEQAWAGEGHSHVHGDGDKADVLAVRTADGRARVLGLAWYSGKVSIDTSLVAQRELAGEVFISEAAHMVDFFLMSDVQRVGMWNALHWPNEQLEPGAPIEDGSDLGHGHGWFDVGGYYSFVGEAFMGAMVLTYSTYRVTIPFDHPTSHEATYRVRAVLTPYFAADGVVHEPHSRVPATRWYASAEQAASSGTPMCMTCFPAAVLPADDGAPDATITVPAGPGRAAVVCVRHPTPKKGPKS